MINLNLETKTKEHEIIKNYLQENVSQILADKINNGVKIDKDNKTLLNKKDLCGFMNYASAEAKKLAEKGQNYACIEDKIVFGWAIHYFEEDSIEGTLFNEDGTEFKEIVKETEKPKVETKTEIKKTNSQSSLFDLIQNNTVDDDYFDEPPPQKIVYEKDALFDEDDDNETIENNYKINKATGEVLSPVQPINQTDKYFEILNNLLDNKLISKE